MRFLNTVALALISASFASAKIIKSCTKPNTIALTFDDGPFEYTTKLLDRLKTKNIHATFFINGNNYWHDLDTNEDIQAILKRAHEEGHQIASHTWYHEIPDNYDEIEPMMNKLDDVIEKCVGYRPKFFRPPRGDCKGECVEQFENLGYRVVTWDTDTNDWDVKSNGIDYRVAEAKKFLTEEFSQKRENYLVLMHDVYNSTVNDIVPWILEHAPFDDYKFVTLAECLGDSRGRNGNGFETSHKNDTNVEEVINRGIDNKKDGLVENGTDSFNLNLNKTNSTSPSTSEAQSISYRFTIGIMLFIYIMFNFF